MKKRLLSLLLAILLICSIVPAASAANGEEEGAAEILYTLGLFKGTGTNPDGTPIFDLDKTPTRNQALIMLVRLLGKEEEALAGTWDIPFTDVSESMRPYVGYAYANGLTNGTSATTYSGSNPIKSTQYIVFVLRALGYEDGVDFQWNNAWQFAREDLFINRNDYTSSSRLTRGDVAIISKNALGAKIKDSDTHLVERVCDKPLNPELPITENSFCFFYPYVPPEDIAGDLFLNHWGHGNPHGWRKFTLIINGSIVRDGYTVECPTADFYDTLEVRDDGFVVSAARKGQATVFVTYEDVTANFRFISFSD